MSSDSYQGRQLGSGDPRAQVLWHGLHIAFMRQTKTMILECTLAAGENRDIQRDLQALADAMGWVIHTAQLDLAEVWPCRRARWWALLMPKHWDSIGLPHLDFHSPFDHVGSIFTDWGVWSEEDEVSLKLTPYEPQMYHDPKYGTDSRCLDLKDIAATILHSYANALTQCPCGCRQKGFHPLTLAKGGLRGYYVISKHSGEPRYLYPHEVAHLLGLPASVTFAHDPRACLALLGFVASPLQVIWIYGHLRLNHAKTQDVGPHPSVTACLSAYCQELLVQYEAFYGAGSYPQPSLALEPRESVMHLRLAHAHHQVQQLLRAERISLDWNESCAAWGNQQQLELATFLQTLARTMVQLQCQEGPVDRLQHQCSLVIVLKLRDQHHVGLVQLAPSSWRSLWTCNSLLFARSSPCRGLSYIQTIDSGILWFCKS